MPIKLEYTIRYGTMEIFLMEGQRQSYQSFWNIAFVEIESLAECYENFWNLKFFFGAPAWDLSGLTTVGNPRI